MSTVSKVPRIDAAFQTKIAALVVRDTVFARRIDGLVKPEMFESAAEAGLVAIAQSYFDRYAMVPSPSILIRLLKDKIASKTIREDLAAEMKLKVAALLKEDISDRDFVVDEVSKFARHQAVERALIKSVDLKEKGEFDLITREMEKAIMVGALDEDEGVDYFESIDKRTEVRKDMAAGLRPPSGITSGSALLDSQLYHQGWGLGEMTVFMGAPKAGKSTALGQFGITAAMVGKNVLYVSLEVSCAIISERMDANLANMPIGEIKDRILECDEKIKDLAKKAGKIRIHQFAAGQFTPNDLKRLLDRYRAKGIIFDLVAVDYADIMAPNHRTQDPIENSKSIWIDLRAIAMKENFAMLTATQANRDGSRSAIIRATDVAEDFNKIRIADLVISINKTEEERMKGEARLFFAASRNQKSEFTVRVQQDIERMQFLIKVLGVD